MSKTHWKKLGDPNFLGGYDFDEGEVKTLTIAGVENKEAFNPGDKKKETVRACIFKENVKPLILNATNSKTLSRLYKSDYIEDWIGRKFNIHFDPTVKVGREVVGGLRILPTLPNEQSGSVPICFECKRPINGVGNMNPAQMAEYTAKKYGKPLCSDCATKLANSLKNSDVLGDVENENN